MWEEDGGISVHNLALLLTFLHPRLPPTALWLLEAVVQVQFSSGYNGLEQPCDLCMGAVSSQQLP